MVTRASDLSATLRVLWLLVKRDLRLRYSGAALGYVWTVLEPLLMTLVYAFVFGVLLKARDIGEQPYILYLVVGVLSWNWFSSALNESLKSLTAEAKIVRTANVPRQVWVARIVVAKMLEFVFALPIIAGFALYFRQPLHWELLLFPLGLLLQLCLSFGLGLILAPLTVVVADVKRVIRILLRIGFYLTPVLYSLNSVGDTGFAKLADLAKLNPMAVVMSLYRAGFWPQDLFAWYYYAFAVVLVVGVLALGALVFRRLEGTVLKEI